MGASAVALLLLACLAGPVATARIKTASQVHAESQQKTTWLTHKQRWCMSEDANATCDGESIIDVSSAFYAVAMKAKCGAPSGEAEGPCTPNATLELRKHCQGKKSCIVPPSFHPAACSKMASFRLVWDCVAGKPPTAQEDTEQHEPRPKEVNYIGVDFKVERRAEAQAPVPAEPELLKDQAETVVEKLSKDPEHEVRFNPCYRKTRWTILPAGLRFLERISCEPKCSSCPTNEGCFMLQWADKREYKDPKEPPKVADIASAELSKGHASRFSFGKLGLKRNNYDTWGICLPKNEGIDFATAVFESLKKY